MILILYLNLSLILILNLSLNLSLILILILSLNLSLVLILNLSLPLRQGRRGRRGGRRNFFREKGRGRTRPSRWPPWTAAWLF